MQIVIDIPEEDYNSIKRQVADGITNPLKICIANGTPHETVTEFADRCRECGAKYGKLLKQEPCSDAISREDALRQFCYYDNLDNIGVDKVREILKKLPSVEPERPKGEWIEKDLDKFRKYSVTCNKCGTEYIGNYDAYDEPSDFNFCPNCGADMREIKNEH